MANYTDERNIQILIQLLKEHGVSDVVASPGTTNISFVASLQSDPFFNIISCVDERSAAYLACGIAAEKQNPVVLTCTGATASRNYAPALTEAFYRRLPVIAVTATQHLGRVGQNVPQVIDRSSHFNDMVRKSIQLYEVHTDEDAWACNLAVNDAILESKRFGGSPVHINMITNYSMAFDVRTLPKERVIERLTIMDDMPNIEKAKVAVFVGSHPVFTDNLQRKIDEFCEKYNGIVICDHTSGYNGKYKVLPTIVTMQPTAKSFKDIDFLIDIGNVSGVYSGITAKETWRVSEDGEIKDTFRTMTKLFAMPEELFFEKYNAMRKRATKTAYYDDWINKRLGINNKLSKIDLPFSNPWIAQQAASRLKDGDRIHLAVLNTLRSWNFYEMPRGVRVFCNTGGFGIDGAMSSAIGDSLSTDERVFCFIGDLAFFYDLNSIGNKNLKNNLRILLVNNGCGTEFHNYNHRAARVSEKYKMSSEFFAADGHYGDKSNKLVRHYAEDLGFRYLSASNKQEFLAGLDEFFAADNDKPMIFEVFTDPEEESAALNTIYNLDRDGKTIAKKLLGEKGRRIIKKVIGK